MGIRNSGSEREKKQVLKTYEEENEQERQRYLSYQLMILSKLEVEQCVKSHSSKI